MTRSDRKQWSAHCDGAPVPLCADGDAHASAAVVHRFRAGTDQRFLGERSSCQSCEFFMMCWMSGGTVRGGCGGFMFGCCDRGHRTAKAINRPPPNLDYGPVRNDPGEHSAARAPVSATSTDTTPPPTVCGDAKTSSVGATRTQRRYLSWCPNSE